MANETLETRIARIERLVRWLAYTVAVAIAIALAAVAALIVQTLYFHASIDAHWHWQSALSFLAVLVFVAWFFQRKLAELDG
jgi:hypothetical protein